MYSVVISTVGGLFIISFLEIKIEIDSRCQIEVHIVPHPIRVLSLYDSKWIAMKTTN